MAIIKKEIYIDRCKKQAEAYERLITGLELLKSNIPGQDKRFTKTTLDRLNNMSTGVWYSFYTEPMRNVKYCINVQLTDTQYIGYTNNVCLAWSNVIEKGKVVDKIGIDEYITDTVRTLSYNKYWCKDSADESVIRDFKAAYGEFAKAYRKLKDINMRGIDIPFVEEKCPID